MHYANTYSYIAGLKQDRINRLQEWLNTQQIQCIFFRRGTCGDAGAENGENDAGFDAETGVTDSDAGAEISANPESGSVAPVRNPPIGWDENRVRPGVSYIKLAPFRYLFVTLTNRSPS